MENNNVRILTTEEVITEFMDLMDIEDSRDELIFHNWVYACMRELVPYQTTKKTVCIEVCNLSIKKPCDFLYAIDMNLLGPEGQIHYYKFAEGGFMESEQQHKNRGGSPASEYHSKEYGIKVGEDEHCYHLDSTASNSNIVKAELNYFAFPFDDSGAPLIPESFRLCVLEYLSWKYKTRQRNRHFGANVNYPTSEVDMYRSNYYAERARVLGNKRMPDSLQIEHVARKWTSLIPNYQNKVRNKRNRFYRKYR